MDTQENKKSILIVDDEFYNRIFLKDLLEQYGYTTKGAIDGEDAIKKASIYNPSLILMDINMPRLNGITATQRIHKEHKDTPIVILSGNTAEEIKKKCLCCRCLRLYSQTN